MIFDDLKFIRGMWDVFKDHSKRDYEWSRVIFYSLTKLLKPNEIVLLLHLIQNNSGEFYYLMEEYDESTWWIYFSVEDGKEDLNMSPVQQTRALDGLIKKGMILKKVRGIPPQRMVRVLYRNIWELIKSANDLITDEDLNGRHA